MYLSTNILYIRLVSSVGEHFLDREGVVGSNPSQVIRTFFHQGFCNLSKKVIASFLTKKTTNLLIKKKISGLFMLLKFAIQDLKDDRVGEFNTHKLVQELAEYKVFVRNLSLNYQTIFL